MHGAGPQPTRPQSGKCAWAAWTRRAWSAHDGLAGADRTAIDWLTGDGRLRSWLGRHPGPRRRRSAGCGCLGLLQSRQHRRIRRHHRPRRWLTGQARSNLSPQRDIGGGSGHRRGWSGHRSSWTRSKDLSGWPRREGPRRGTRHRSGRARSAWRNNWRSGRRTRSGTVQSRGSQRTRLRRGRGSAWRRGHPRLMGERCSRQRLPGPGQNLTWSGSGRFRTGGYGRGSRGRRRVRFPRDWGETGPRTRGLTHQWRTDRSGFRTNRLLRQGVRRFDRPVHIRTRFRLRERGVSGR